MELREVEWTHGLDRSGSSQGQVEAIVSAVMNLWVQTCVQENTTLPF
jgi:hypothetical protein